MLDGPVTFSGEAIRAATVIVAAQTANPNEILVRGDGAVDQRIIEAGVSPYSTYVQVSIAVAIPSVVSLSKRPALAEPAPGISAPFVWPIAG
jgi:hypothetical protein